MLINNGLHCHQSTYNLGQITRLAKKIHDPLTREWLADKIVTIHNADKFFNGVSESQVNSVNHALKVLNDTRRVR